MRAQSEEAGAEVGETPAQVAAAEETSSLPLAMASLHRKWNCSVSISFPAQRCRDGKSQVGGWGCCVIARVQGHVLPRSNLCDCVAWLSVAEDKTLLMVVGILLLLQALMQAFRPPSSCSC